jgi:hypothetical protein
MTERQYENDMFPPEGRNNTLISSTMDQLRKRTTPLVNLKKKSLKIPKG